ncbi:pentapeptide repeat-containing protein, partial [Hymenobacter agri]
MPDSPQLSTIGAFSGGWFLAADHPADQYPRYLAWPGRADPDNDVVFSSGMDGTTLFPVALYRLDGRNVQLQAVGHNRWLCREGFRMYWGTEPTPLTWIEADDHIRLECGEGGLTLEAFGRLDGYIVRAGWQLTFRTGQPALRLHRVNVGTGQGYPLSYPSPEELRSGEDYGRLNFFDVFLLGTDLKRARLAGANFARATLRDVTFTEAGLEAAQFPGVVLSRAGEAEICRFNGADLRQANFAGAQAERCRFDWANLLEANFQGAKLAGADFGGADRTRTDFTEADLTGAIMYQGLVDGATFVRGKLARASFAGTRVRGADFTEADLTDAQFQGTIFFVHLDPVSSRFTKATLRRARFDGANAIISAFDQADLREAHFEGAMLSNANFSDSDLSQASFAGADLPWVLLNRTVLTGTDFSRCTFRANWPLFADATLRGTIFTEASLISAQFPGVVLSRAGEAESCRFNGANLAGSNFAGAQAERCRFDWANL